MSNVTASKAKNELEELELDKTPSSKNAPVLIKSPQSLTHLSATSRSLMDELRERHKLIEARGAKAKKDIHPGELLTLDKLGEALQKYNNLSIQAKSTEAINIALKQLADYEGGGKERLIYLYPFLINHNNKVVARIALISPQTGHEVDVRNYRTACFQHSKKVIDLILANRARKIKEVKESNPGHFLFYKNESGESWLYPHLCSIESEITMLLKRAFKPNTYISVRDFVEDFVEYGKSKGRLKQVLNNYHLIIDELDLQEDGSYKKQPETVIHYRAQADGLEKFTLQQLKKLANSSGDTDFIRKLNDYKREQMDASAPDRQQSREKVKALLALVQKFSFQRMKSASMQKAEKTCKQSIAILENLIKEMDSLIGRKFDSIQKNLMENLSTFITEHTKRDLTLIAIDIRQEVFRSGVKDDKDIQECIQSVSEHLHKELGVHEVTNEEGRKVLYCVDQGYMVSVLHKLTSLANEDSEFEEQLEYAKLIEERLKARKDSKLNSMIKDDHLYRLNQDISKLEKDSLERKKREEFQAKYNVTAGLMIGLSTLFFAFILSLSNANFFILFLGFIMSVIFGYLGARFFRKKDGNDFRKKKKPHEEIIELQTGTPETPNKEDNPTTIAQSKEQRALEIAKIADSYVFPKNYNKIADKILVPKTLRSRINEHLDDIRRKVPELSKEEDLNKVSSSIEYSLMSNSVVIAIPSNLIPNKNFPSSIIINRSDFKAPLMRNQMAEYYRETLSRWTKPRNCKRNC